MEVIRRRLEVIQTRWEMNRMSRFPSGLGQGHEQESGRVGEISNMPDILPTLQDKPGNNNQLLLINNVNIARDPRKNP